MYVRVNNQDNLHYIDVEKQPYMKKIIKLQYKTYELIIIK